MASELVVYKNQFNMIPLRKFNAVDLDFLMSLCHKFREKGGTTIEMPFSEIRKLANYQQNENRDLVKDLKRMNEKLLGCHFEVNTEQESVQFVLFTTFKTNPTEETLTVKVNDEFAFLLNELDKKFTEFELKEFLDLHSSYAKECYRRLKQFRTQGWWEVPIDEFRRLLDIPDSYRICHIDQKVLNPIKKELSPLFDNFKITKKYRNGRGRGGKAVAGIKFTFDKEIVISKTDNTDNEKYYEPKSIGRNCPQCGKPLFELSHNGSVFYGHYFHVQGEECRAKFSTIAEVDGIDETPTRTEEDRKPCSLPPSLQARIDAYNRSKKI